MRLLFMGTPDFAVPVLEGLHRAGHFIAGVVTQPDKPSGRGRVVSSSPMKRFAQEKGLPVLQPASLCRAEALEQLSALKPEAVVIAAYGRILPPDLLAIPPLGCLNIHPSLLPRYRGPSPVVSALLDGVEETGVSVMLLDEGMDTGPILAQERAAVRPEDTAASLTQRLFQLGAALLLRVLPLWEQGALSPAPQDNSQATVTRMVQKEDGELGWALSAEETWRRVRAYDPWPGAYTRWRGRLLKVLEARPISGDWEQGTGNKEQGRPTLVPRSSTHVPPGTVVSLPHPPVPGATLGVVTGSGLLALVRLQLEGSRPMSAADFANGHRDFVGSRLPS